MPSAGRSSTFEISSSLHKVQFHCPPGAEDKLLAQVLKKSIFELFFFFFLKKKLIFVLVGIATNCASVVNNNNYHHVTSSIIRTQDNVCVLFFVLFFVFKVFLFDSCVSENTGLLSAVVLAIVPLLRPWIWQGKRVLATDTRPTTFLARVTP